MQALQFIRSSEQNHLNRVGIESSWPNYFRTIIQDITAIFSIMTLGILIPLTMTYVASKSRAECQSPCPHLGCKGKELPGRLAVQKREQKLLMHMPTREVDLSLFYRAPLAPESCKQEEHADLQRKENAKNPRTEQTDPLRLPSSPSAR